MTIFDRLMFSAMGGKPECRHGRKENKRITKLQDFLSDYQMEKRQDDFLTGE